MPRRDDIQKLIALYNRRLQKLREQEAVKGLNTPPEILIDIEDIEAKLSDLQAELETTASQPASLLPDAELAQELARSSSDQPPPPASIQIGGVNLSNINDSNISIGNISANVQPSGDVVAGDKTEIHHHYYAASPGQPIEEKPRQPFEPEMVLIAAGPFVLGEAETGDWIKHQLELPAYEISKYPITNRAYLIYVEKAGVAVAGEMGWELARVGKKPPVAKLDHPVVGLSWDGAVAYCRWLQQETGRNYRLPTEAEWEKAARGGDDTRPYPWGDTFDANRCNIGQETTPVTHFPPQNPYGICDLVGNVWEWTLTMWGRDKDVPDFTYPYPSPTQPDGRHAPPQAGATYREYRICRGGSFRDKPERLRCSSRARVMADGRYARRGFRVVRELS